MEYTYIHNHQSRFIELFEGDEYPLIKLGDYTDFTWGDTNTTKNSYVTEGYLAYSASGPDGKLDHFDYDCEGIVLSAIGSDCGKTWFASGKWSCIKNTIRFWSTFDDLDNRFLYFATREKDFWPRRGGAQPFIPQGDARNCSIPLPPICLQRKFVEIAEQADKSKFDGFKSRFIEWFGNPFLSPKNGKSVSITDVADIVLGTTPNSKIKEYWDGELKWITPAEIEEESFIISDTVRHITEDGRNSANLTLLPVGSVLFSTRAPIGKVAIAGEEMYCNQGFKNFICKPELNNVFLYYTLRLNKEYLVSLGTGTTFKELSKKIVESIKISVPAKEQQEQFETLYRQADKSKYYKLN